MTQVVDFSWRREYDRYMSSPEWQAKRAERIVMDDGKCVRCGSSQELQVHHRNYDRFGGDEEMSDLETLCKRCHQKEHGRDPVIPLNVAWERRMRADNANWVNRIRFLAARADKQLVSLFAALTEANPERDPRFDQIYDLIADIMRDFEEGEATWIEEVARLSYAREIGEAA